MGRVIIAIKFPPKLVTAYFATWDEYIGPVIVDCYPSITNSPDLDIENINLQIYTILQAVFGNVKFEPISFTLPLKFAKRLVRITFTAMANPKVRGGYLPLLNVILLPLEYPEDQTYLFNLLQEKIVRFYSQERTIKMEKFYPEMSSIVEDVSKEFKQKGDIDFINHQYSNAITHYEMAEVLLESIDKGTQAQIFQSNLNQARSKRAQELSSRIIFQLSYFHRQIGPMAFEAYPDQLTKSEQNRIAEVMDIYFEPMKSQYVQVNQFFCLSRYFEVPSDWAPGNKEMLLISAILPEIPNIKGKKWIDSLLEEFTTDFSKIKNIFTVFYQPDLASKDKKKIDKIPFFKDNDEKRKKVQDLLKNMTLKTEELKENPKEN